MKKEEWISEKKLGKLYLEKVLVTFDVPELFVCVDKKEENRYLVVLLDADNERYLCVKVTVEALLSMLCEKTSMEDTFRQASDGIAHYISFNYDTLQYDSAQRDIKSVPSTDLPERGGLFTLKNPGIVKYISDLEKVRMSAYMRELISIAAVRTVRNSCDWSFNLPTISITSKTDTYKERCPQQFLLQRREYAPCLIQKIST